MTVFLKIICKWHLGLVERAGRFVIHNTGIAVYFYHPYGPLQIGPNENMNGVLRQYLPKGTDLSFYSQAQLNAIADQINNRPLKV